MTQLRLHKVIGKYHLYQIHLGTSLTVAICRPDNKQNHCGLGKNGNVRSSTLEEVRHCVWGNGHIACSSSLLDPSASHEVVTSLLDTFSSFYFKKLLYPSYCHRLQLTFHKLVVRPLPRLDTWATAEVVSLKKKPSKSIIQIQLFCRYTMHYLSRIETRYQASKLILAWKGEHKYIKTVF